MKTSNLLPEECKREIEDKLESVKLHWKDKGKVFTESFSGWLSALNWILGLENADQPEDHRKCQWQHAWGPEDMCLVCGAKNPLKSPQTSLSQIQTESDEILEESD